MKSDALIELERLSRRASDCSIVSPAEAKTGGVDPLGLRQINFDLMNEVFPGLNNVARHIRPFTLVAWAWRRTIALASERKERLRLSAHEDFVARIEVAFAWSLLQRQGTGGIDLPGKQRIAELWGDEKVIGFGDEHWADFVKARRNSTALTAAINYGPGLRAFRILVDDAHQPGVRVPGEGTEKLLDAFEKRLTPILDHKLFNGWGPCSLKRATAEEWADVWDMDELIAAEREAMCDRLVGEVASRSRRGGFRLLTRVCEDVEEDERDEETLRPAMFDLASNELHEEVVLWRRVQVRQAFRLALEALFEWIVGQIGGGTLTTEALAQRLLKEVDVEVARARDWFSSLVERDATVVSAMAELQSCMQARQGVGAAALAALAVSVLSPKDLHDRSERRERLPIALALADVERLGEGSPAHLLAHVIESWIIAQHTYWSVGRGLADARAGGKRILRLRLVLEPGGWRVTRGKGAPSIPRPTPDRLRSAISLAREASMI
ncbi:hypothetical protein [uncultured Aureimonas sp.]|uniref:hypothetical protein n=1 Tax=uncultured Aureimonas sp. TaxID=1604662 RepID=UPI0025FEBBDC|nr:hypothetical protein [uncultured Aureimonas sp.]